VTLADNRKWIIIGSDRRPETKQGIEGKIDRFRSGKVRVKVRDSGNPIQYVYFRVTNMLTSR